MSADQHLPTSWMETTLDTLLHRIEAGLNVKCDERPPNVDEKGLVKISAVTWGQFDELQSKTLPSSETPVSRNRIQPGDLLISRANTIELVGASVIVKDLQRELYLSDKVLRLVVHEPSKRWINYALKTPALRKAIEEGSSGNQLSMRNISQDKLKALPLPLAPEAEQKRIADKLDTVLTRVDAVNTRLARVAPLLKRFRQSVLAAATSGRLTEDWRAKLTTPVDASVLAKALANDHLANGGHERGNASEPTKEAHDLSVDQLPFGWQVVTMKDCCVPGRPITYGILKPGPELEVGVPYIRVADFPGNRLNLNSIKKTSPEIDLQYKRARLVGGDLLLSIRGSVGRLIEIPAALDGANITQDTARLSISQRLNSKYIFFVLLAPDTQKRMSNAIRGVAVRGINIGDVRALQAPIPTEAEQTEIVRRVETLFAFADRLEARLAQAQTAATRFTPALLAKAFRGELVPQDPNDEPAAELLRRLQAERATAAPASKAGAGRGRGRKAAAVADM